MYKILLCMIITLTLFFTACSHATMQKKLTYAQELQDVLDNGIKITNGTGVSAAVIVGKQGQWVGVSGLSDPETQEAITPNMLFDIASAGKTFTAVLVLQLAEQGRLSLDDSLREWLPDFPNVDNSVTIRQLLNHTSGIAHFTEHSAYWNTVFRNLDSLWTPEDILTFVPEPIFRPGEGWHYSSANYVLLGMIIESATGSTLAKQLQDRIFTPLNLRNTYMPLHDGERLSRSFAHAHFDLDGNGELEDIGQLPRTSIFSSVWASGPIVSTAEDLARWAEALFSGNVLTQTSFDQMIEFHRPTPDEPFLSGYGLGAAEVESNFFEGARAWGHLGWQPGYLTAMLYFPDHSVSLTVMINDNNENCITHIATGLWRVVRKHLEPSSQ